MKCPKCKYDFGGELWRFTTLQLDTLLGDLLGLSNKRIRADGSHYYEGGMYSKLRLIEVILKVKRLKARLKKIK